MNTPIYDFVKKYAGSSPLRLHMPGHKGQNILGIEHLDITEISGADSLYSADGIIKQSEENAAALFGTDATFYSTEGSSLCIRAMLELIRRYALKKGEGPYILAGRNAHKVFTLTAGLLNINVDWLINENSDSYLTCTVTPKGLENAFLALDRRPTAVYLTSPDYLGNILDIKGLAKICRKYGVLLAVDNAHGAYLNFLQDSLHPANLGADICCDSAHKTLPVLTGGAYLHLSKTAPQEFKLWAREAMALFGSTSPSYIILQSLDLANKYINNGYKNRLSSFVKSIDNLKIHLKERGFDLYGNEPLKITIKTKSYGYTGTDFAKALKEKNIFCEFCDPDYLVLMLSLENKAQGVECLKQAITEIPKRDKIKTEPPDVFIPEREKDIHTSLFAESEEICVDNAVGRVLASANVGCPPAVPIIVCGERISAQVINALKYYEIEKIYVIKQ